MGREGRGEGGEKRVLEDSPFARAVLRSEERPSARKGWEGGGSFAPGGRRSRWLRG